MRTRLLALAVALAACQGTPSGSDDALVVTLVAGTAQTAFALSEVGTPPTLMVTRRGEPVAGVSVTFAVIQGGGIVTGATTTTGADGVARVESWVLGTAGPQAVRATVDGAVGSPLQFTATATLPNPVAVAVVQGQENVATVGLPVTFRPILRVVDEQGRPIPGVRVTWQLGAGSGGLRYADPVTNLAGVAGVGKWVVSTVAGENTLVATAQCGPQCRPITFRAVGHPGPVSHLVRTAGQAQTASAGGTLTVMPTVRIADAYSNVAPGRPVQFEVISGGGSVSSGVVNSDADGLARVSWTLGDKPGVNLLRVTVEGVETIFTATGT